MKWHHLLLIFAVWMAHGCTAAPSQSPPPAQTPPSHDTETAQADADAHGEHRTTDTDMDDVHDEHNIIADAPVRSQADPARIVTVRPIPFARSDYPAPLPSGAWMGGFAFLDRNGTNYVVFTRQDKGDLDHIRDSTLTIAHVVQRDDQVRDIRHYKERIHDCDFDIILTPLFGDWSVSDVNHNGIGEANFAYTAACVSDVSPLPHKVFITEDGDKYVLRGETQLPAVMGDDDIGGSYIADTMPADFLRKAEAIWRMTALAPPYE